VRQGAADEKRKEEAELQQQSAIFRAAVQYGQDRPRNRRSVGGIAGTGSTQGHNGCRKARGMAIQVIEIVENINKHLRFGVDLCLALRYELVQNTTTGCSKRKSWWVNRDTSGVLHADDPAWKSS
jgi:hypothetical protein